MGGKSKKVTVGYWYLTAYHVGLCVGEIDAFLEFRGGDVTAWKGEAAHSQTISINKPNLWGGEKDQGGIVGDVDLMFGEPGQQPNAYLSSVFGPQQPAWRGLTTVAFKGGKYGAMSPYPQKASYKVRKIQQGWDRPCWYPEKADIVVASKTGYPVTWSEGFANGLDDYSVVSGTKAAFTVAPGKLTALSTPGGDNRIARPVPGTSSSTFQSLRFLFRLQTATTGNSGVVQIYDGSGVYVHGFNPRWPGAGYRPIVGYNSGGAFTAALGTAPLDTLKWYRYEAVYDEAGVALTCRIYEQDSGQLWGEVSIGGIARPIGELRFWAQSDVVEVAELSVGHFKRDADLHTMNPAHTLYYVRTHGDIGREPTANMNDASYRAAADRLHAEGFGICWEYDSTSESLEEFEQRICKLIGGSVSRSLVDGQYYLDLARGDYVLADLPVISDADILAFKLQPATLDGAINSLSVKYFDPEKKEEIVTPPAQSLGLIDAFGTIHQVSDYPEIPTAELAALIAERDLRSACTPKSVLDLDLIPTDVVRAIRPNQYFRLQSPKRRIADMVCLLGERQAGTLRSGGVKVTAAQDIYSLPSTAFVEVEPGVDTRPDQTPYPISNQAVFEAPYIELVQRIDRANMDVIPVDAGYLLAVAAQPTKGGRSYDLAVQSAGGLFEGGQLGDWCPAAVVAGGPLDVIPQQQTLIPIDAFSRADQIVIGSAALWDSEIVRVDAIGADDVTLGRGCADTVAAKHSGGSRIWFYDDAASSDLIEYSAGETVAVKLLTNTGNQQLSEAEAAAISVTFDQRQARPYPPANVLLDGQSYPQQLVLSGDLSVAASHRDRLAQADQLVDQAMASIGPEMGTSYVVRNVDLVTGAETYFSDGITSWPHVVPAGSLSVANRLEVYSMRDGLESWQRVAVEFSLGQLLLMESGDLITTENGQPIQME